MLDFSLFLLLLLLKVNTGRRCLPWRRVPLGRLGVRDLSTLSRSFTGARSIACQLCTPARMTLVGAAVARLAEEIDHRSV